MKTDNLLHDLFNQHHVFQSELNRLPKPKTKSGQKNFAELFKQSQLIRELVYTIRVERRNELVADSIFMNPLRLIWLDDNVDSFLPYIDELKLYGIAIVPFLTGQEAMDHIRDHSVDGALVDLKMPGEISGLDFIEATAGQIPSVVVSSYIYHAELQRTAINKGAVGILEKQLSEPGTNASFAKAVLGFFSEERRFKAVEYEVRENSVVLGRQVRDVLSSLDQLPDEIRTEITPFLETISVELSKENPDIKKISSAGSAASNIAQGAAGNLAANGILHLLAAIF